MHTLLIFVINIGHNRIILVIGACKVVKYLNVLANNIKI